MITKRFVDDLEYQITGACIEVHKVLGPGLLESVYHKCVMHELTLRGIHFISELRMDVEYKGIQVNTDLRADLFIESCIVLELKAVQDIIPIHEAKIISYMKLLEAPKGMLINFHCVNIVQEGKKSYVNEYYRSLP